MRLQTAVRLCIAACICALVIGLWHYFRRTDKPQIQHAAVEKLSDPWDGLPSENVVRYPASVTPRDSAEIFLDEAIQLPAMLQEYEGATVIEISVRGCTHTSEEDLLRGIRTRIHTPFNEQTWQDDYYRLAETKKYLDIRFTEPKHWPGGVKVTIDVIENALVDFLLIDGVDNPTAERLKRMIGTVVGRYYNQGQVFEDRLKIKNEFDEQGYRNTAVETLVESLSSHLQHSKGEEIKVDDGVKITFNVKPGVRARIRKVDLKGINALTRSAVLNAMESRESEWYCAARLYSDKKRLENIYRREGFADIHIDGPQSIDQPTAALDQSQEVKVDVEFKVSEGARYSVGNVFFKGNVVVLTEDLERRIALRAGAALNVEMVELDRDRLQEYYLVRGWKAVEIVPVRIRVTDSSRMKAGVELWDLTYRITEGPKTVLLDFAGSKDNRPESVIMGGKMPRPPRKRPAMLWVPEVKPPRATLLENGDQF